MKRILYTIIIAIIFALNVNSQWYLQYSDPEGYFNDIDFTSTDYGWVAGLWKMIRTTDGGNSWDTLIQRSQSNTTIQAISFVDSAIGWYIEQNADENHCTIYKTINGGDDWIPKYTSPKYTLIWDMQFIDQNIGFCLGQTTSSPVLWKTTNGGDTWNMITVDNTYGPDLMKLYFLNSSTGWVAGDGIYSTTDGGSSWNMLVGPYGVGALDIQFTSLSTGWYSDGLGINKTTDGGSTWNLQTSGGDGWHGSSLYFFDADTGYFCPFNNVLKTTNGGSTWVSQLQGNYLNLSDICFVNSNNGWLVGYAPGKIYHTGNGGTPVELISFSVYSKEKNVHLEWITASEINNRGFEVLRAVTNNNWKTLGFIEGNGTTTEIHNYSFIDENIQQGNYKYRLKQIDFDGSFEYSEIAEIEISLPNKFSLAQNFPNPFNPSTKIKYQVSIQGLVTLKVYDVLGKEVADLINEEQSSGNYEVTFNGNNLSNGIYFYELRACQFSSVRKMILLK